ncbi:MAG: glycosyltransferase [Candidatus Azobacteroides sp.]|nr:glycosyltransferase [Candidatus Azobacteroides sp.]
MTFLFVVQGEGRGHLTQAIALREMLTKNGHEVAAVLVGKSNRRELPSFFLKSIQSEVLQFKSPNFLPASKNKQTNIWKSVIYNLLKTGSYLKSIHYIRNRIKNSNADIVVNFYEMLTGLTYALFPPKIPYICIAHQYIFLHPEFQFPQANKVELGLLRFFTRITCIKSSRLFALSVKKMDNVPESGIVVVPPLLRKDVLEAEVSEGNYLHGYMLNDTYADKIIRFQAEHPDVFIRFFWDRKGVEDRTVINDHLSFYRLNDKLFIGCMAGCKAYATTAGFESVCEAMYMGKPVLMVPTHIEQACNAYEASLAGAGIVANDFELDKLLEYTPHYQEKTSFREWVQQAPWFILKEFQLEKKELLNSRLSYRFIFKWS